MKNEIKKSSYIEGIGSIVINAILFNLKYWVGIMIGSIAIIADEDRRSFHVHLSDRGKNLVKMHGETHNRIVDMLQNNLDSKDLEMPVRILNKVVSRA